MGIILYLSESLQLFLRLDASVVCSLNEMDDLPPELVHLVINLGEPRDLGLGGGVLALQFLDPFRQAGHLLALVGILLLEGG